LVVRSLETGIAVTSEEPEAMATSSARTKTRGQDVWRELVTRQGEAYEAYGRALKGFGQRSLPVEALLRDVVDLAVGGATDAVNASARFAEDYYRWAWSLIGISADPEGAGEPEPRRPTTAAAGGESSSGPEAGTTATTTPSPPRAPRRKG